MENKPQPTGRRTDPFFGRSGLPFFQAKRTVNTPGDAFEREADSIADRVMQMRPGEAPAAQRLSWPTPEGNIQRTCACEHAAEEEEGNHPVQRKETTGTPAGHPVPSAVSEVLASGGESLGRNTRQFMESRLGRDFSQVRVHTDARAAESARMVQARAYTTGQDIVFGSGEYRPDSESGQRLLAHELVHVGQQDMGMIRRTPALAARPTPAPNAGAIKAAKQETDILAHAAYAALDPATKSVVADILAIIKTKPLGEAQGQRNYYLEKLKIAITTPSTAVPSASGGYGCSPDMEKKNRTIVDSAIEYEKFLNFSPYTLNVEERAVATGTNLTERTGEGGKKFTVDRSDPRNIRAKIKVKLNGKSDEVAKVKLLEDAIERRSYTTGYVLDVVFVDTSGPDVFELTVVFCEWPNSGNWATDPTTLSHEVHHALGLDDRYDYIESHADNAEMDVPTRLKWFKVQLGKTAAVRDPYSKMYTNSNSLLSEDVCAVAFETDADIKKCIEARKDLDPAGVPPF